MYLYIIPFVAYIYKSHWHFPALWRIRISACGDCEAFSPYVVDNIEAVFFCVCMRGIYWYSFLNVGASLLPSLSLILYLIPSLPRSLCHFIYESNTARFALFTFNIYVIVNSKLILRDLRHLKILGSELLIYESNHEGLMTFSRQVIEPASLPSWPSLNQTFDDSSLRLVCFFDTTLKISQLRQIVNSSCIPPTRRLLAASVTGNFWRLMYCQGWRAREQSRPTDWACSRRTLPTSLSVVASSGTASSKRRSGKDVVVVYVCVSVSVWSISLNMSGFNIG